MNFYNEIYEKVKDYSKEKIIARKYELVWYNK